MKSICFHSLFLLFLLLQTNTAKRAHDGQDADDDVNIFDWKSPGLGRHVTFCFVQAAVYFVLVFLLESNVIRRLLQSAVSRAMAKQRDDVTQQVSADVCC